MSAENKLTTRQSAYVAALVSGLNRTEASATVGISASSGRRYMTMPAVRMALNAGASDALGAVTRRLNAGASDALDVLQTVMNDASMPPAVRVRAALGVLELGFRAREMLDLDTRLEALEIAQGGGEG